MNQPSKTGDGAHSRPKVVIIGAGFGGLSAARALEKEAVDITVIDRRNFHLFQPLLYQVATAALSPGDIAWPIRSVFSNSDNVEVLMMDINSVDIDLRTVGDGTNSIPYDYLIVATGATHAYFGHDDWAQFAPGLKTMEDARSLRDKLLSAFEHAELSSNETERRKYLTTVIIGGGATGVELAGALADLSHRTLKGEFRGIDPSEMRIVLIEAGPRLLSAFPLSQSDRCVRSLRTMGVEVKLGSAVTSCSSDGVGLLDEHIDAATIVWAAGVQASAAAQWLKVNHDRANRVLISEDLSVPGHPDVFVIGDTSHLSVAKNPVPGVASAAKQMGAYVAKVITARVRDRPPPPPFVYKDPGKLAVIGRKSAVVSIKGVKLSGFPAWIFWCLVHILFLIDFRSKLSVTFNWGWSFITHQRSARLISDRFQPARPKSSRLH
ncbi:NAD(P)/FAD-dependent oxidoreductase [Rhizobium tubonense]|uniref:NADH:ubiquinone reductase (non-electrogenic) n=1 Tax=Rhizobium tubonense TaxID=484088 RepID=A0A2W4CAR5_9HYPH|nr:NAD(P)/FAD-dependent oxidoreductase [Rhizobium tubonense]PZM08045.1 FAD-dependent oxidoreductase [Rhizobium tubonense]